MDRTDFAMKMAQFVADAPDFGVSRETLEALENFSCHIEHLKHSMGILHSLVWGAMEGDEKAGEQAAHLSETLLEIATIRDKEISQIISTIHPLTLPPLE